MDPYRRSSGYDPSMGHTYGMDLARRLRSRKIRTYDPDWTSKYNAEVDRIQKLRNPLQTNPFPGFARQPQPEIEAAVSPVQGPSGPSIGHMAGWMGLSGYGEPGPAPPVGLPSEPFSGFARQPYVTDKPYGPSNLQSTGAQSGKSSYYFNPDNLAKQGLITPMQPTGVIPESGRPGLPDQLSGVKRPAFTPSEPGFDAFETISGVASGILNATTGPLGAAVGLIGSLLEGTPDIEDPDPERLSYNRAKELMDDTSATNQQVFHGLRKQALATQPTLDTVSSAAVMGGARGNQAAVLGLLNAMASNRRAMDAATGAYGDWTARREGMITANLRTDLEGRTYMSRAKAERDAMYSSPFNTLLRIGLGSFA